MKGRLGMSAGEIGAGTARARDQAAKPGSHAAALSGDPVRADYDASEPVTDAEINEPIVLPPGELREGTRGDVDAQHGPGMGAGELPELVIRPRSGWIAVDWSELMHHRELLYFLVWRDVKVRYKQTVLGVAWAVLQPLFGMAVFTLVFGNFAKVPSDGVPYAVFVFAGLLPWTFFSNGVTQSGQSLVNQQQLLTKVYFPRLMVPAASFGAPLVDLAISFGVLACVMALYGVAPSWGLVWLPALLVLTIVAGLGVGFVIAALTVTYRDFRFVISFMMQAWMYLSPVVYPVTLVPRRYQWVLALNPMAGIIDAYRAAILGTPWKPFSLAISSAVAVAVFVFGLFYFRKTERRFADIV